MVFFGSLKEYSILGNELKEKVVIKIKVSDESLPGFYFLERGRLVKNMQKEAERHKFPRVQRYLWVTLSNKGGMKLGKYAIVLTAKRYD